MMEILYKMTNAVNYYIVTYIFLVIEIISKYNSVNINRIFLYPSIQVFPILTKYPC